MLAVEGFVKTLYPWALRRATRVWVVELLPELPETTTKPFLAERIASLSKFGAIELATVPGKAEPPPRRKIRIVNLTRRPIVTASTLIKVIPSTKSQFRVS